MLSLSLFLSLSLHFFSEREGRNRPWNNLAQQRSTRAPKLCFELYFCTFSLPHHALLCCAIDAAAAGRRVVKIRTLDKDSDLELGYRQLLFGLRLLLNTDPSDANAEAEACGVA